MQRKNKMNYLKRLRVPVFAVFCSMTSLMVNMAYAGPQIEHWQLDNGARVYWVHSNALPIVDVNIAFDAGKSRDPEGKEGLSAQVAMMNDKGILAGTDSAKEPAMNENQIADAWLDLGAIFNAGANRDEYGYSLRTLTYPEVLPGAVTLAARVIASPSFTQDVLRRDQERMAAAFKESLTQQIGKASCKERV